MKFLHLLAQSKLQLAEHPGGMSPGISLRVFDSGARWMCEHLNGENNTHNAGFNSAAKYSAYGILKYTVAAVALVLSALLLGTVNAWLIPLSIIAFYVVEVHFLFLFPLLIDNVKAPLWTSIKQTYRTGLFSAVFNVIPIGFFMVLGLLRFNDPLRNWYIGCLAVIIWYKDEVRDRL